MSTKKSDAGQTTQVRIAIANIAGELVIETNTSITEVKAAVAAALGVQTPLVIQDARGHEIVVAADKIGFVDIGVAADRRVGFGVL
jgi:Flp pilus assembly secretin CpaC